MNGLLALLTIFLIYSIGDIVAAKTKAILSMMFLASIMFMAAFWSGLPGTLFKDSSLAAFGNITIAILLVHMGTTIKLKDFVVQWKTVIVSFCSVLAICFGVYFISQLFIDRYYSLMGAPVLGGGMVAFLIMKDVGEQLKQPGLVVFGTMVLIFHGFVGFPLASYLCKEEALYMKKLIKEGKLTASLKEIAACSVKSRWNIIPKLPEQYNTANVIIFKLAAVGYLSTLIANKIGINPLVICLILGVVFCEIGFLDEGALIKANGFGFVIAAALCSIFAGLANTTPKMVLSMLKPMLIIMVIGIICCALVSILVGKFFGFRWKMSFAIGVSALFGFPGTYIISKEVSNNVGDTDEEKAILLDNILPKLLIAGMVSVSIVSVLVASLMVKWI